MQRYLISCGVQVVLMSTVDVFVRHCVFACSAPTLGQILAHDVVAAAAALMRSYYSSCCGSWLSDLRHTGDCEHCSLSTTALCDCNISGIFILSYGITNSRCRRRRGASALGCGSTGEKKWNYNSHFYIR